MSILVTGGNGFIGSHMCKLLYSLGEEVVIIDNGQTSSIKPNHNYGLFYCLDIADAKSVSKILIKHRVQTVFHFAARSMLPESEKDPILYYNDNYIKTFSLIQSCIAENVENFIFSSTCLTYGDPNNTPITESTPQNPINTYGMSKFLTEKTLTDLSQKGLINAVTLRYFNACGGSPDLEIGENLNLYSRIIPSLCKSIIRNNTFEIMGNNYPTRDGTCIRDYIHVMDLVDTHYSALEFIKNNPGHHEFNLGTGTGTTVLELVNIFENVLGKKIDTKISNRRIGDLPFLVSHSEKAKEKLNFNPKYSIKDAIIHTIAFLKKRNLF